MQSSETPPPTLIGLLALAAAVGEGPTSITAAAAPAAWQAGQLVGWGVRDRRAGMIQAAQAPLAGEKQSSARFLLNGMGPPPDKLLISGCGEAGGLRSAVAFD